jgi:hypothetical protein
MTEQCQEFSEYLETLPSRQARHQEWRRTKRTPCPILSWCNECQQFLPVTNFYLLASDSIQGKKTILREKRHTLCCDCHSKSRRDVSSLERLLQSARRRAKAKGIEFSLESGDVVIPEYCPALGLKLQATRGVTGSDCSPSLDRIDNSKGYVKDNVAIVSFRANTLKNSATAEELRKIIAYLRERQVSDANR